MSIRTPILVIDTQTVGSISAALSSPVFVPPREESFRGRSAGPFPEQRLVIEPTQTVEMV